MCFMMNHALGTIGEASTATFSADDVSWVLTVPAIWDSGAKQFMRLAAKEAGLIKDVQSEKLVIALEPEAAAIWCKQLPWSEFQAEGEGANLFEDSPRIQYIVVDCGGGTVDMTVHEFQEDQSHKELHKASGGGWGGTMVDQNFSEFLRQIFHSGVWEEYAEKHPAEMQRMMYDFAHQKCLHKGEDVVIRCCHGLLKVAEKRRPIEEYFDNKEGVSWLNGLIMITHETMKSFYDDCLANILGALRNILDEAGSGNVKYIFLVGGFAASFILRDTICNEYGKNLRILCPRESQVAIMKGALMFGNDRIIVPGIVCGRTYGTSISNNVYSTYRDVRKKKKMPESEVFRKLVGVGETVPLYKDVNFTFFPHESEEVVFTFFISPDEDPQFTDEAGVKPIGSVCLPLLKQEESHQVNLIMRFGLSTIKVTVSAIATRETATVMLELLRK